MHGVDFEVLSKGQIVHGDLLDISRRLMAASIA
jgi:hypothetical protein